MPNRYCAISRPFPALALMALIACAPAAPAEFTEVDAQAVRDTVTTLENAMNLAIDGLDWEAMWMDLPAFPPGCACT